MFKEKSLCYHLCVFFICCVAGWLFEVLFRSAKAGILVIPGFLYGCYLPVYGFGALMLLFVFSKRKPVPVYVFVVSFVMLTVFEYITHLAFDKIFGVSLWSYSAHFCNINGRVSLKQSIMLGAGGVAFIYVLHPLLKKLLSGISERKIRFFVICFTLIIAVDFTFSVLRVFFE